MTKIQSNSTDPSAANQSSSAASKGKPLYSLWRRLFGRSLLRALIGTDLNLQDRQTTASILAIMVAAVLCYLCISFENLRTVLSTSLSSLLFVMVGFYFKQRSQEGKDEDDGK